jgi:hypothetical protein
MAPHIIKISELRRSAEEAALDPKMTADDCPDRFAFFSDEWKQEFKKAKFALASQVTA